VTAGKTTLSEHSSADSAEAGLFVKELTSGYGGLSAIRDLTFHCAPGEVLAMIGPNGAGKTTCLNTLAGLIRPMDGEVRLWGESIRGLATHRIARAGVALLPSDRGVFPPLTVREHLMLAMRSAARKPRADTALDVNQTLELLPSLRMRINARASQLSGGERQMLAIAKAVMLGPKVLLVDELSLGLAPKLVQNILPVIRRIADTTSAGVILVEQHYELGLAIADRCVVMSHGEIAFEGSATEVLNQREKVESVYLARRTEKS
jgi:branched-chain amino acid transport system ATP-binding protein